MNTSTNIPLCQYVGEREAASILSLSVSTLQKQRHRSVGPKYVKLSRAVRYNLADLYAYMEQHKIEP